MISTYKKGSKEKLSANFFSYEFDCNGSGCCEETKIDLDLVNGLQQIRDHFGKPLIPTSPYRCPAYNARVENASPNSKHMEGIACDFYIPGVKPLDIAKYAESIGFLGIGLYDDFVHVDRRTKKSFWYGHQQEPRTTFGGSGAAGSAKPSGNTVVLNLPVLRKGAEGETVHALQVFLAGFGYIRGMYVTGEFKEETEEAVKDFQKDCGISQDGIVGSQTWGKIFGL